MKYEIGDTVVCNTSFPDCPQKGWKGKVIYKETCSEFGEKICIEWEHYFPEGHNGMRLGKEGYCRFYVKQYRNPSANIELINKVLVQLELF